MVETRRDYYGFQGLDKCSAEILELRPCENGNTIVLLDKTIFYPEGGGQSADRGTINGFPVLDVRESGGEIHHIVSLGKGDAHIEPGPAELVIDSRHRRDLTITHTAQHLLSGTLLRLTGKPTVSAHLGEEISTIDVDSLEFTEETLFKVEEAVADAIEGNGKVVVHLCPPEDITAFPLRKIPPQDAEIIRVIEIEGGDFSPCCGTHAKTTGEIGILQILGAEKYKGMTRISFIAGRRCLVYNRVLQKNAGLISRAISVPINETGRGVLDYIKKTEGLELRLKTLEEASARVKAAALIKKAGEQNGAPYVIESYAEEDIDEVLRIGRQAQKSSPAVFVLASEKDIKFTAMCGDKKADVRPLIKDIFAALEGRGGGGASFFQGSFSSVEKLKQFMEKLAAAAASAG